MGEKHSRIGASSAKRWMNCPGSVNLIKKVGKKPSGPDAHIGSAAHQMGEKCLLYGKNVKEMYSLGYCLAPPYNDVEVTPDIRIAVQEYLNTIWTDWTTADQTLSIEEKFHLSWIDERMYGTADAVLKDYLNPECKILRVYDYKNGKGIVVEADNNPQQMYYAVGAIDHSDPPHIIELIIVQPRAYHAEGPVRRWKLSYGDLMAWVNNSLAPAVAATKPADAPLVCGPWCTDSFCDAIGVCPKVAEETAALVGTQFSDITASPTGKEIVLPSPEMLTKEEQIKAVNFINIVKKWGTELATYIQKSMERGEVYKGLKLVEGRSSRVWKDPAIFMRDYAAWTAQIMTEPTLKSVAQVEAVVKESGGHAGHLKQYWDKKPGRITVAPESDKRAAIEAPADSQFAPL